MTIDFYDMIIVADDIVQQEREKAENSLRT